MSKWRARGVKTMTSPDGQVDLIQMSALSDRWADWEVGMTLENSRRCLFSAGILLFLLALGVGMIMPLLPNMRMGLSAHLVGILGALFLIALGSLWSHLYVRPRWDRWIRWLAIFGTYSNLITVLLSAIFATSRLTPLAGSGHLAAPWQENIVTFGLVSSSTAMVAVCILVLWGLNRHRNSAGDEDEN